MKTEATQRFTATDGFQLAYRCWNANTAKHVVVCIHGIGDYSGWFRNIAPELAADGSQVYALDLRGFGESQETGRSRGAVTSFERHLQDIDDFIVHLHSIHEEKKVFLFGHSLGGLYSIWYAANHPSRIDGLVLAAPAIVSSLNKPRNSVQLYFANKVAPNQTYKICASQNASSRDPEEVKIMLEDPLETTQLTVSYLSNVKTLLSKNVMKNAPCILAPVLILQGDADQTVPTTGARQFYEKLWVKDKKLEVFPDAGHWFYDALCPITPRTKFNPQKRAQFADCIKTWLRSH